MGSGPEDGLAHRGPGSDLATFADPGVLDVRGGIDNGTRRDFTGGFEVRGEVSIAGSEVQPRRVAFDEIPAELIFSDQFEKGRDD